MQLLRGYTRVPNETARALLQCQGTGKCSRSHRDGEKLARAGN